MCSIRIIKKVPDLAENFINAAASLLKEKHHGVLISGVELCTELCKVSTEALDFFRKVSWQFSTNSVLLPAYDFPWIIFKFGTVENPSIC